MAKQKNLGTSFFICRRRKKVKRTKKKEAKKEK